MSVDRSTYINKVQIVLRGGNGDLNSTRGKMEDLSGFKPIQLKGIEHEWHANISYNPTRIQFYNGNTWGCYGKTVNINAMLHCISSVVIFYVIPDKSNLFLIDLNDSSFLLFYD